MNAHAHICRDCNHESWRHGLIEGQDVTGLYRCGCGCIIPQDHNPIPLTKREYDAWKSRRGSALAWPEPTFTVTERPSERSAP